MGPVGPSILLRAFAPLRETKSAALKTGQVCAFAPERYELLIRPGPRIGEAALALADCLAGLPER